MTKSHLAAVDRCCTEWAHDRMGALEAFDEMLPHVRPETLDAMYERMIPEMQNFFLGHARQQTPVFESIVAGVIADGRDPTAWSALRDWVYRQPFTRRKAALSEIGRKPYDQMRTFEELLP